MTSKHITLIDYGGSNLRSVQKAFEFVGAPVQVTAEPESIWRAGRLVLPGVGAFGAGMAALRQRGLDVAIREAVDRGALLLGICLGMQFLCDESEEMGRHAGLGLIPGRVTRFAAVAPADEPGAGREEQKAVLDGPRASLLKVPHIGWNQIEYDRQSPLLAGIANGAYAYFVHSYYCIPAEPGDIVAQTEYGCYFAAIAGRGNVFGIQFHPEKSQQVGQQILRNFVALT